MILLHLEDSLERLAIKRKLGFQQVMIILFENILFIDVANFPEKQQDRAFDSAAVNHLGDLLKLHMIREIT